MEKVIEKDPFVREDHQKKKPLYAALVPDEIFKSAHFERRFVTPFGKVWEKLAKVIGEYFMGFAEINYKIHGEIPRERLRRISETLNALESNANPDWKTELRYVLNGNGPLVPVEVICDVFISHSSDDDGYAYEIKAPLPNSDQTKVSKEKLFKLYAMEPVQIRDAYFALPYNPYGKKDNYDWKFPMRWFDMHNDPCVLIGDELWNKLGGIGTYDSFISVIRRLGRHYHERIYNEYMGLDIPEDWEPFQF